MLSPFIPQRTRSAAIEVAHVVQLELLGTPPLSGGVPLLPTLPSAPVSSSGRGGEGEASQTVHQLGLQLKATTRTFLKLLARQAGTS